MAISVDAWMETCLIGVSKQASEEVQFAALTETVDTDLGDKDIEGIPLVNGGRITKFNPEADSSITFEAYPLEAGAGRGYFGMVHTDDVITNGTTTSTSAGKLVDTGKNFTTLGVAVGDKVINTTDNTSAYVTAVDTATQLSVSSDIMTSGEDYILGDSPIRVTNARNRDKYRVLVLWTDKTAAVKASEAVANTFNALRIGLADGVFTVAKASFTDGILKFNVTYKTVPYDKTGGSNVMMESCAAGGGSDALPAIADYTTSYKYA